MANSYDSTQGTAANKLVLFLNGLKGTNLVGQ